MRVHATELPGVLVLEPKVFTDERGFFLESYNRRTFSDVTGSAPVFVQDNHSRSVRGVLRGLHYQLRQTQGKLISVVSGRVFGVAVDVRRSSPRCGHWTGVELSADSRRQLWIPPGFASGFMVQSEHADLFYKTTDFYDPESERCIMWNDPDLDIRWPAVRDCECPILSVKDSTGRRFRDAEMLP